MSFSEIGFSPSTLEVDYDKNMTELYRCITDQEWDRCVEICKSDPSQAKTWVVRHYDDEDDDDDEQEIMWRFLPLHSACARQPPISVVAALLRAYPDGAKCQDDQKMYPLHYACGNQAARDVVRILLVSYPDAAKMQDPRLMLPIHYLACWGPSSVSVVDMLLVANPNVSNAKDVEGNTPLDLAREGEYLQKDAVIAVLEKWFSSDNAEDNASSSSRRSTTSRISTKKPDAAAADKSSHRERGRTIPINTMHLDDEEEEKKEEDESFGPSSSRGGNFGSHEKMATSIVSQDEMKNIQDDLSSLRKQKTDVEIQLSEEHQKNERQEAEIVELRRALAEAKRTQERNAEGNEDTTKELEKTKSKLKGCQEELKGLRIGMVDLMDEHDKLKQHSTTMNNRLTSLSVSLEALMEQQKELSAVLKNRSVQQKKSHQMCKESLKMLMEREESEKDENEILEAKLKKQSKEMEAISAMIAAARD